MTYPKAVKAELKELKLKIDDDGLCHSDTGNSLTREEIIKEFKSEMDKISLKILKPLLGPSLRMVEILPLVILRVVQI